jgi:succinoglycan biosynthesis transport protein ExoP
MNFARPILQDRALNFEAAEPQRYELRELLAIAQRQRYLILACIAVFAALAIGYVIATPKKFTAQATILIDPRRVQIFRQDSVTVDPVLDAAMVESQIETVKSETVILAVIRNLKLSTDPEFVGASPSPIARAIAYMRSFIDPASADSEEARERRAVGVFRDNLDIRRVGLSYAIAINYTSISPSKAASIANEVAEAYTLDQIESKFQVTQRAGTWLQGRIRELQKQASDAEKLVLDFKADNKIVDSSGRLVNEQQLTELNTQLGVARAQTAEARARLDRIAEIMKSGIGDGSITDALRSEVLIKLRQEYLEIVRRESDWSQRFGANHQAAIQLRADLKRIERVMTDELKRIEQTYQSEYEIAKSRQDSAEKAVAELVGRWTDTRQAQVKLRELEGTAQSYRALHDTFVQRYLLAVQQQSFPISDSRLITKATPPTQPSAPKGLLILAGALALGAGIGGALALARELLDTRLRTARQLTEATGADCIGVLPIEPAKLPRRLEYYAGILKRTMPPPAEVASFSILQKRANLWTVLRSPFSVFAETVRNIKVSIDAARTSRGIKNVGVISAGAGEGKTTTIINLALLIARTGSKVLVIDCDLRNPHLTRALTPDAQFGLIEVVSGAATFRAAMWREEMTGACFLPAVTNTKPSDTAEILASDAMRALLAEAAKEFDYVLLDTPPVNPVVDVRAFAHFIDGFVLVASYGDTTRSSVERTATADFIQPKLLGSVLNKVDVKSYRMFETYDDRYYSDSQSGRAA